MMLPQVFRGRTIEEARKAAQAVFGEGAVVITTRKIKREGIAGALGGEEFEIAAAPAPGSMPEMANRSPKGAAAAASNSGVPSLRSSQVESSRGTPFAAAAYTAQPFAAAVYKKAEPEKKVAPPSDIARLRAELRGEMRAVKSQLSQPTKPQPVTSEVSNELAAMRALLEQLAPLAQRGNKTVASTVRARGIEGPAAVALTRVIRHKSKKRVPARERLRDALADMVHIGVWPLATLSTGTRRVIALVGPAGVGKTTTAAKLAARVKMEGRTVAFVACDVYRVGAIEQLRRYASLLDAPVDVARNEDELAMALTESTADVVIVDTSGIPPVQGSPERLFDSPIVDDLLGGMERHVLLCLPAALRNADAEHLARAYAGSAPTAIAITKIDETEAPSGLLHASLAARLPVTTLCYGQRVPEDIGPATFVAVLDYLAPKAAEVRGRSSAPPPPPASYTGIDPFASTSSSSYPERRLDLSLQGEGTEQYT